MIKNINNSIVLLLSIILLLSCVKKKEYFYYAFYTTENGLPESYIVKEVLNSKSRKEIDFMFSQEGKLKSKSGNIFKVTNVGLKKKTQQADIENYKPYLTINNSEYINFEYVDASLNDFASTSFKFIGKSDIEIEGIEYKDAYQFVKQQGSINTVTSLVFFDKDFILIKEEFLKGDRSYYRIERIDRELNFKIE